MDKLEKHIKDKLRNREISPSPDAWNKIAGELESKEDVSSKKGYWWAIAASLVGLIVLSVGFFNTQKTPETAKEGIVISEEGKTPETIKIQEENAVARVNGEIPEEEQTLEIPLNQEEVPEEKIMENTIEVAQVEAAKDKAPIKDVKEVEDLAISSKLEEVLAQVNAMESNANVVSDAEIDSLLLHAQRELLTEKVFQENGKVDAMALLDEVELELYDDQQNPLFIRLKEGFFRLRTAVADRNN